jgi:N-methylhydantoinase A
MKISHALAVKAVQKVASQLGLDVYEAAEGICTILASNMANAIRSRTVQKGLDPREFTLVAFGGAGPMTALDVANALKMSKAMVPVYPGITSALGLLTTDLKYEFTKTQLVQLAENSYPQLDVDLAQLKGRARVQLLADGVPAERVSFVCTADLRYAGQGYELRLPLGASEVRWEQIGNDFHARHTFDYGHAFRSSLVEVVALRVTGIGPMPKLPATLQHQTCSRLEDAWIKSGETYFRDAGSVRRLKTEFYRRSDIPEGAAIEGPAVLLQKDSTTVIAPGWTASVDKHLNLLLTRNAVV